MSTPPGALPPAVLIALAVAGVAVLVVLVSIVRLHAFLALTAVALALGLAAGLSPGDVLRSFQDGVGATLGAVALVIALGALLGTLLAESGGAEVVANAVVARVTVRQLPWAVGFIGFVLGTPVFFPVGLVLLVPVVRAIAAAASVPFLLLAVPLIAGLSASHGLVPPHPGPIVAVGTLNADPGVTLVYSLVTALLATVVAGPLFALVIVPRLRRSEGSSPVPSDAVPEPRQRRTPPALAPTLVTVLLPVILMLGGAVASLWLPAGPGRTAAVFLGNPLVAMAVAVFVALAVFGWLRGSSAGDLLLSAERSLWPVAGIVLVVGAGGGFGRVLDQAGVGRAIADCGGQRRSLPLVARMGAGGAAACERRIGHRGDLDGREPDGADRGQGAGDQSRAARRLARRRVAHRVARERRRLLAREGILEPERRRDLRNVDRPRDADRVRRSGGRPASSVALVVLMLIVDAHLDLAMNAMEWNRDLSRPLDEIRAREAGTDRPSRSRTRHRIVRRDAAWRRPACAWRHRSPATSSRTIRCPAGTRPNRRGR